MNDAAANGPMKAGSRGADVVVQELVDAGVSQLFTLSGNQILSIYDAAIDAGLRLIHTRHEAAAVHMADAWGRLTGEPGVALVTAGPGHCNALAALYVALAAESPVLLLSGHCAWSERGTGAFQEIDQVAAARPVAKASWIAEDTCDLRCLLRAALTFAPSGRPGPVHVSLPVDILEALVSETTDVLKAPVIDPSPAAAESILVKILDSLADSKRPLILAGSAMARGQNFVTLTAFSETTSIPVLPLESPRGVKDPALRSAGVCLKRADLILLMGKRLDFSLAFGSVPAFGQESRFIQIDAEAAQLRPHKRVLYHVWADPSDTARRLTRLAKERQWPVPGWKDEVAELRNSIPAEWETDQTSTRLIHPLTLSRTLKTFLEQNSSDAVVVIEGGEFGQWVQAMLDPKLRVINGPSGAIGGAVPMGLAAQLKFPDRHVIVATGDGSFGYHALEFDTAVRYGLPIITLIGNDGRWNAEYQIQVRRYGPERAVACELRRSRYDQLVQALGGYGELVDDASEVAAALRRAAASRLPACLNVLIEGAPAPRPSG